MKMKFTASGIEWQGRLVPYTELLACEMYLRPEKRRLRFAEFRAVIHSFCAWRVELMMVDDLRGFLIPVELRAEGARLTVRISGAGIVESAGNSWRLMEISVLPKLLETSTEEEGAYLLPVLSGYEVPFRGQEPVRNRDRVYVDQGEWEKFGQPDAFGMTTPKGGVLAVVRSGAFFAWVDSSFNQDGRNQICATFGVRHTPGEECRFSDKEVFFEYLEEGTNYSALAIRYRKHLIEERGIVPLRERVWLNPVLDYSVHALRVKIFMGQKQPFVADGASPYVCCTTFAEAGEILDAMHNAGLSRAVITLVGWNRGGHDGAYPTRFPVNESAGGEAGLAEVIAKALSYGYQIVPHDNVTDVYLAAPDYDPALVSHDEEGERQAAGLWAGGLSYKNCPLVTLRRFGGEFKRIHNLGFRGSYYLDAQSTGLFRCSHPDHPADEETFALALARIALWPRAMFGAVSTECAPAYMLPYLDEVARLSGERELKHFHKRFPESFRKLRGRCVPFYMIAVHGLIVYQANWVHAYGKTAGERLRGLLREFGEGARPSMEVSMRPLCNGGDHKESIASLQEAYHIHFELCPELQTALMTSYEETSASSSRITYDTGLVVEAAWGEKAELKILRSQETLFHKIY